MTEGEHELMTKRDIMGLLKLPSLASVSRFLKHRKIQPLYLSPGIPRFRKSEILEVLKTKKNL